MRTNVLRYVFSYFLFDRKNPVFFKIDSQRDTGVRWVVRYLILSLILSTCVTREICFGLSSLIGTAMFNTSETC